LYASLSANKRQWCNCYDTIGDTSDAFKVSDTIDIDGVLSTGALFKGVTRELSGFVNFTSALVKSFFTNTDLSSEGRQV